ncbi:MAG: hypothetical protein R3F55_08375 [Alphaproteobacteria bacterium]
MSTSPASPRPADREKEAFERRRRQRNLAVLVALLAFVVLIYVVTLVKFEAVPGAG